VNHLVHLWRRPVARVLVLAFAVSTVPACCLAGEPPTSPPGAPKLAASIDKAVRQEVALSAKASPNAARQAGATSSGHSFFKSKTGRVTLVLLAAGTGFALYSTSHDRVKSPEVAYGGTWK
jgi:hypothetical protein